MPTCRGGRKRFYCKIALLSSIRHWQFFCKFLVNYLSLLLRGKGEKQTKKEDPHPHSTPLKKKKKKFCLLNPVFKLKRCFKHSCLCGGFFCFFLIVSSWIGFISFFFFFFFQHLVFPFCVSRHKSVCVCVHMVGLNVWTLI